VIFLEVFCVVAAISYSFDASVTIGDFGDKWRIVVAVVDVKVVVVLVVGERLVAVEPNLVACA
jgi:hypothetical protein